MVDAVLPSNLRRDGSPQMFKKIDNYYTQSLRIDLNQADELARLNPSNQRYANAAKCGQFVITVMQGDVDSSVYTVLMERLIDTQDEAIQLFLSLVEQNPDAAHFNFIAACSTKRASEQNRER